jgi:hypothetical protein
MTSVFVVLISLIPIITKKAPRKTEIAAGISSPVPSGLVLEIQRISAPIKRTIAKRLPFSGNGCSLLR